MATVPTQEMDFFEKIGYTFSLWNESWGALKLNLLTFIILYLLQLGPTIVWAMYFLIPFITSDTNNVALSTIALQIFFVSILITFVYVLFYPFFTLTQLESAKGNKVALGDMFNRGIKYLPAYIVLALVLIGVIGIPFLISFLLIPVAIGIFLFPLVVAWAMVISVFVMFVPYIIINDNLSGIEAIKKAITILKVKWQWVLAVYAVFMIGFITSSLPLFGAIISLAISIIYFCMPAIVYLRHIAEDSDSTDKKPATATKKATTKKTAAKK